VFGEFPALRTELILTVVETAAVLVSAIAGMIVASNKGMDLIGVFTLACVNAFGGGTVRDLLLDNRPFYWNTHWGLIVAIFLITIPFVYNDQALRAAREVHRRSVNVDALGLALFTVAGVGIAFEREAPLVVAILMGVVTGTMGGVLRDVVVNEIPDLFRPGALYATASFVGASAFIAALQHELAYAQAAGIGIVVVVALRLVSVRLGVRMPAPQWIHDPDEQKPRPGE
jgi:uncharacterized membrane protein YeiH